jgi:CobQ-like glutamine amidotransferase family enzyme
VGAPEIPPEGRLTLTLAHLYPDLLNIYGDRGNVLALVRRAAWRGVEVRVRAVHVGEPWDPEEADLVCIGGGEDRKQAWAAEDLAARAGALVRAVEGGLPVLAVCGGYQLLGRGYQPAEGPELPGVGVFDAHTAAAPGRLVGNVLVDSPWGTLVGFENHSGRTYLGPGAQPLGRVRPGHGAGNNGVDGTEGAVRLHAVGTYLHGALLPKNPRLADFLLRAALARRYGALVADLVMAPLDDRWEEEAHRAAARLARGRRLPTTRRSEEGPRRPRT